MKLSVIIPTCEAAGYISALLRSLEEQTIRPDEVIVVDSASQDGTAEMARRLGATVLCVERSQFDHGGTRDMAFRASSGDIVLFLTQDALPADTHFIEHLTAPFSDEQVGAASGRQLARDDARPYEKLFRQFRYPAEDRIWDLDDLPELGLRSFHISDVCSAYRRSAYMAVGGFEHPLITNEDMLIAADLLKGGYRLAYCAKAMVHHSHSYTFMQEYRRNRLIGRFMQRYSQRLHGATETGEGLRLMVFVLAQLARKGQFMECIRFVMNCAARLLGSRAGRRMEKKAMSSVKN